MTNIDVKLRETVPGMVTFLFDMGLIVVSHVLSTESCMECINRSSDVSDAPDYPGYLKVKCSDGTRYFPYLTLNISKVDETPVPKKRGRKKREAE